MGKIFQELDEKIRAFIARQQMFFVATAPASVDGLINLSPKGLDSFAVLDGRTVAYLDFVGSGAETIAHLRENGRIVIMFCAFQGPPMIVRLHGRGEVVEPQDAEFASLRARFDSPMSGRSIIRVHVERIADTCGFGVPRYTFEGHRTQLTDWCAGKGDAALETYQQEKNAKSLDGLPALRWTSADRR